MSQTITATFENGILRPDSPLSLPAQARVRLTFELLPEGAESAADPLDELDHLCDQFPIDSGGEVLTRDQLHERR